jgi:N-methylhydantoinase A
VSLEAGSLSQISTAMSEVETQAKAWFEEEAIPHKHRRTARRIDMRYEGQNHELPIPVPDGSLDAAMFERLKNAFAAAHTRMYGFAVEGERINCVTFRVEATGVVQKADLSEAELGPEDAAIAKTGARDVWYPETGTFTQTKLYARDKLRPGMVFEGPAIVEQMDTTTLVPPKVTVRIDTLNNLILELVS